MVGGDRSRQDDEGALGPGDCFVTGPVATTPVEQVKGIGPKRGEALREQGVGTVADLLLDLPRRYLDRSQLAPVARAPAGEEVTLIAHVDAVQKAPRFRGRGRRPPTSVTVSDDSGTMRCVWFQGGQYLSLQPGDLVALSGKVEEYRGARQLVHPEYELVGDAADPDLLHTGSIVPLYSSSEEMKERGLQSRGFRRFLRAALDSFASQATDGVSRAMAERLGMMSLPAALRAAHFPESRQEMEQARRRLAFGELFWLQGLLEERRREREQRGGGLALAAAARLRQALLETMPFELTGAQQRVLAEIDADMARPVPMRRLLHGDVGSGKTLVALLACLSAVEAGHQVAVMAPTEVLAEQHLQTLTRLCEPLGLRCAYLVGGQGAVLRRELLTGLASGAVDLVVGTHALLQPEVRFASLGAVVVDEQHRFGVTQRQDLYGKGPAAHVLIMTATPIPRSLALTLYGDLDVSVLDELPAGRQPIRTALRAPERRERIFSFVAEQLRAGRQAYIVYPLIEESERSDLTSVVAAHAELAAGPLAEFEVGLLHGRLASEEKAQVMGDFAAGRVQALVSTTVIEVGVDVPNATIIVIEHAERFGLAQLHQMRGRVGRGTEASYCVLVAYPTEGDADPADRLQALCDTQDGFELARRDLELRGPGELLGLRQAGVAGLRVAHPVRDEDLLVLARDEVRAAACAGAAPGTGPR